MDGYFSDLSRRINKKTLLLLPDIEPLREQRIMGLLFATNPLTRLYFTGHIETTIGKLREAYSWALKDNDAIIEDAYQELPDTVDDYTALLERQNNRPFFQIETYPNPWGLVMYHENPRKPKQIILRVADLKNLTGDLEKTLESWHL